MIRRFFSLLTLCALLFQPLTGRAAAPSGSLIRTAENAAVYYLGADGKRYAFPNDKVFFSWYTFFSNISTVTGAELASYPLGGLVTYRPGIKLVKITTDPKVYAVSKNGLLRWVQTETLAIQLYGSTWAKQVDDIPDAFFTTYQIGTSIAGVSDYSPASEQASVTTIDVDKNTTSAPAPVPTPTPTTPPPAASSNYTASITVSNPTPSTGGSFSVLATSAPSASVLRINLYLDGTLQRSCTYAPCGGEMITPPSGAKPTYEVRAETLWIDGYSATATTMITPKAVSSAGVTLSITRPEVKPNSTQEIVANVDGSFVAKYIDIFLDGGAIRGCTNVQICRYSFQETSALGTTHSAYTIAQDANGIQRQSTTQTYTVVTNDHPLIQIAPAKTNPLKGEFVDVTITASDEDGIAWTEIWSEGALIKRCNASTCTATTGPWNQTGTYHFVGRTEDGLGLQASKDSIDILVQ